MYIHFVATEMHTRKRSNRSYEVQFVQSATWQYETESLKFEEQQECSCWMF